MHSLEALASAQIEDAQNEKHNRSYRKNHIAHRALLLRFYLARTTLRKG